MEPGSSTAGRLVRLGVAIIVAAAMVFWLDSAWPDVIVASAIAVLFLNSAREIIGDARSELARSRERR